MEVIKMPRGDKTGPDGNGPRTGRGLGYCSGYDSPGFTKGVPRGGAGYGRGFGRGYGRGYWRPSVQVQNEPIKETDISNESKKEIISEQIQELSEEIDSLKKEIKKLK